MSLRLLTTYFGAGTEWLPNSDARRDAVGHRGNAGVVRDGAAVQRLATGWIGIFKGEAFPGNRGNGCIHRSPPIEHRRGSARVLLCIDDATDC